MTKKIKTSPLIDQLLTNTNLPHTIEIMAIPLLLKFKVLVIDMYDGSKDLAEEKETFKA